MSMMRIEGVNHQSRSALRTAPLRLSTMATATLRPFKVFQLVVTALTLVVFAMGGVGIQPAVAELVMPTNKAVFTLGLGRPQLSSDNSASVCTKYSSCVGGISAFVAVGNYLKASGASDHVELIPEIDIETPFVHMHPRGRAINMDVFALANITHFFALPSFYSSTMVDYSYFFEKDAMPIASNIDIPRNHPWRHFVRDYAVFTAENSGGMKVAVARFLQVGQTWVSDTVSTLATLMKLMRMEADIVVIICGDFVWKHDVVLAQLEPDLYPDVFIDLMATEQWTAPIAYKPAGYDGPKTVWVSRVRVDAGFKTIAAAYLNLVINKDTKTFAGLTITSQVLNSMPTSMYTPAYVSLREYIVSETLVASQFEPVLTYTLEPMEKSRLDGYYPCFTGECAQGNIYAGAYYWRYNVDFAMTNSGGPRGPAIPAGNVRMSDVWGLISFANYPCTGKLLGLKIWEMISYSLAVCNFSSAYHGFGSRIILTYGMQIDYDNSSLSDAAGTRVRAIRIYDRASGVYKPLERLRLYTFATDNYQCESNAWYTDAFTNLYEGEEVESSVVFELVQETIALYLQAHVPYAPLFVHSLTNTPATTTQDFIQWQESPTTCGPLERWYPLLGSCRPCPAGEQQDPSNVERCVEIPKAIKESLDLTVVIVPIIGAVVVIGAIIFIIVFTVRQRHQLRNTRNAPKGSTATIVFTDVQMSTKLWGSVPSSMGYALDQHHALIRAAIREMDAYEVKTVGDSFMIALDDPRRAAELAIRIQLDFHNATWPRCIDQVYNTLDNPGALDEIDDNPFDVVDSDTPADVVDGTEMESRRTLENPPMNPLLITTPGTLGDSLNVSKTMRPSVSCAFPAPEMSGPRQFVGIRVRIGINTGPVEATFDEVAKGYDYYGNTVNMAARLEAAGSGGQIIISREVASALQPNDDVFRVESLGTTELRGIEGKTEVLQLTPVRLSSRVFGSLRGQCSNGGEVVDAETLSTARSERSTSQMTPAESTVFQSLFGSLRPLASSARVKHIRALAQAWRIDIPKKTSDTKAEKLILTIIAQRLNAASGNLMRQVSMAPSNFFPPFNPHGQLSPNTRTVMSQGEQDEPHAGDGEEQGLEDQSANPIPNPFGRTFLGAEECYL